jgi:hypothetical protein
MDDNTKKPIEFFKTKEEFNTAVDELRVEAEKLTLELYNFGIKMASAGMLSSGVAEAYIGLKATVSLLEAVKESDVFEQLKDKINEHIAKNADAPKDITEDLLKDIPSLNKYLN